MTAKRIGRRMTLVDRFHSWQRRRWQKKADIEACMMTGFYPPVYPGK
jgi:hypothetical protein